MTELPDDPQVKAVLRQASQWAELVVERIRAADLDAAEGLARIVRAGGWLEICCQLTATGHAVVRCDAVEPSGDRHQLEAWSLEKVVAQ